MILKYNLPNAVPPYLQQDVHQPNKKLKVSFVNRNLQF